MNYYAVVEFCSEEGDDGELEVIPDLWLINQDTKCYWSRARSSTKLTSMIADRAVPKDDWEVHKVKRVFGKYCDYLKAREKARLAEDTSDINSDAGKRKRRTALTSSVPKNTDCLQVRKIQKIRHVSVSSGDSSEVESLPGTPPKFPATPTPLMGTKKLGESSKSMKVAISRPPISAPIAGPSPSPTFSSFIEINSTSDQQLLRDVSGIKIRLTQIEGTLQLILGQLNSRGSSNDLRKSFGFCFPVDDTDKFHQLEGKLSEDLIKNDLFNTFKGIGGANPGDMTRRILRQIMTDKVATGMNWLGGRSKLSFSTTKVICVIKDAVLEFFGTGTGTGTAKIVEFATKEWLKQSANRLKKKSQSSAQVRPSSQASPANVELSDSDDSVEN